LSRAIVPSFTYKKFPPGNKRQRIQLALAVALSTELQGAALRQLQGRIRTCDSPSRSNRRLRHRRRSLFLLR